MKASGLMLLGFVSLLACACAEAYDPSPSGTLGSAVLTPTGGVGGMQATGGAAADPSLGGMGGIAPPLGEPCTQNDVLACPCEGSDVQGMRICRFDTASPMEGFFTDCQGCPVPAPPEPNAGASGAAGMASAGAAGMAGSAAGAAGDPPADAGTMEEPPTEPVDDCEGVPEGTECDRDCILPSNTARCNESGDCSCL
jgi:hypothetical protein